jgi:GTPase
MPSPQEFDAIIADVEALQSEIAFDRVKVRSAQILKAAEKLSARQRSSVAAELEAIVDIHRQIDRRQIRIAVVGLVGRGKSSLLNALIGTAEAFATGPIHGVTQQISRIAKTWRSRSVAASKSTADKAAMEIEWIDTPGLDEIDGIKLDLLIETLSLQVQLVLFVVNGDLIDLEWEAFTTLRRLGMPIVLVFNQIDRHPPDAVDSIASQLIRRCVPDYLPTADWIATVAASPKATIAIPQSDGDMKIEILPQPSEIESLSTRLDTFIHRDLQIGYISSLDRAIVRWEAAMKPTGDGNILDRLQSFSTSLWHSLPW